MPIHLSCSAPLALFTKIQHLSIRETAINTSLLRSLSALKRLESLILNFSTVPGTRDSCELIHGFQHLTHLELLPRAADMALFFTLLNPLEALTELDLVYPNRVPNNSSTYRGALDVIRARRRAPRLARIKLNITTRLRSNETLGELVQPLLDSHFHRLTNVAVDASRSDYHLPASDFERMARA